MRFLDRSECEEYVSRSGVDHQEVILGRRIQKMKSAVTFFYQSRMEEASSVSSCLVEYIRDFSWAMLWAYDLPFGDRSREENPPSDWRRYSKWRRSAGENRMLYDAPGHLFEPHEKFKLGQVIEFAIYMGWDAVLLAQPLRCLITLSHDDLITVQARHNVTALSDQLRRLGLSASTFDEPRLRRPRSRS
jgi:hypothetical protein